MLSQFSLPLVLFGLVHLAWVQNLPAAVIDLFTDGPQTAGSSAQPTWDNRNQIPLSDSLFEARSYYLRSRYGIGSIQDGRLTFAEPGNPATSDERSYLGVNYTSSTPVYLLGDGATAFLIKFEFFAATYPYSLRFYVGDPRLQEPFGSFGIGDFSSGEASSGEVLIPFSFFTRTDLTQVQYLGIDASRMPAGTSFAISSITTVPEPTFPALASGLAVGLLLWRKRPSHGIP
jgi:hypothetical protein